MVLQSWSLLFLFFLHLCHESIGNGFQQLRLLPGGSHEVCFSGWGRVALQLNPSTFLLGFLLSLKQINIKKKIFFRGAWVAQSVKRPTSAQVTISRSVSSSPVSGSGLMAQSLEPVSDSVSPSLSAPPPFMLCLSLSPK